MKRSILFFLPLLVGPASYAQESGVDLGECGIYLENDLNMLDGGRSAGSALKIQNGRIVVNNPSMIVSRDKVNGEERYKYRVRRGDDYITRTLRVVREKNGTITVQRIQDFSEVKRNYSDKVGLLPVGGEANMAVKNGKCMVNQASTVKSSDGKNLFKEVSVDSKYCDDLANAMRAMGPEQTKQCVSFMEKAGQIYERREQELRAEGKQFSPLETNMMGAAMKIAMCSPAEWRVRLQSAGFDAEVYEDLLDTMEKYRGSKAARVKGTR